MYLQVSISTNGHPEDFLDRLINLIRESDTEWLISNKGRLQWKSLNDSVDELLLYVTVEPGMLIFSLKPEETFDSETYADIYGKLIKALISNLSDRIRMIRIHPDKEDIVRPKRRDAREDTVTHLRNLLLNEDKSEGERIAEALRWINEILEPKK